MISTPEIVERALAASDADECIVLASVTHSANVRWANHTLTTNGVSQNADVTVISVVGGDKPRTASVSRSGIDEDTIPGLVAESRARAEDSPPAEDAATLIGGSAADDFDALPGEASIDALGSIAEALAAAFDAARSRDEGRYGYAEHSVTTVYLGSSTGLRLRDEQFDGRLEMTGRSADGSRSAWAGSAGTDISRLDVAALEEDVVRRLDWSRRRVDLDAGRYDTILPPSAVADLLVDTYWAMGALDAHEGGTVFARPGGGTRIGDALTESPLSMFSDPSMRGRECTPFVTAGASSRLSSVFDNGLPLERTNWIQDGELRALLQTRHSSQVTGLPVTPYIDNLAVEVAGATDSVDDIVRATDRGLLLTCLWYIRQVDPQTLLLTGLTRDGVFLVEDGEVVGAVNNFRFNESPVGMLRRITAAGRTEDTFAREFGDYFTRTGMPALRIADFNMSSVSKAS
jgi:predicted Zn-dependent protease